MKSYIFMMARVLLNCCRAAITDIGCTKSVDPLCFITEKHVPLHQSGGLHATSVPVFFYCLFYIVNLYSNQPENQVMQLKTQKIH